MASRNLAIGMIFLLQTVIGGLGNFSLLYHHLYLYFTGCRLKPTDLIVNNLIVSNFLVLFFSGFPYALSSLGLYNVYNDFGCKFFPYVRSVGRGVSIGTTSLLSIFQAITVSLTNSKWAHLKQKAPRYTVPSIFLYWILQMLVNVIYPVFLYSKLGHKNITNTKSFERCLSVRHNKITDSLYAALLSAPDVFSFILMLWASGSMVFILYRHKQRMQHFHRTHVSSQTSPESRATKTILLLVSTFVLLNMLSCIFQIILGVFNNPNWFILNITSVIALTFPTVSPFLIMSRDSNITRISFTWIRNTKSRYLRRNV